MSVVNEKTYAFYLIICRHAYIKHKGSSPKTNTPCSRKPDNQRSHTPISKEDIVINNIIMTMAGNSTSPIIHEHDTMAKFLKTIHATHI